MKRLPHRRSLNTCEFSWHFIGTVVALFCLATTIGCRDSDVANGSAAKPPTVIESRSGSNSQQQVESFILQPQGAGQVNVKFTNDSDNESVTLYRVQGNQISVLQKLEVQTDATGDLPNSCEVDSGFYFASLNDGKTKIPVPAFSTVTGETLCISIQQDPPAEDGWCWIPRGPFIMGDTLGVGREDERPARLVELPGFWMAEKEVTNGEYAKFLSEQLAQKFEIPENWIDLRSKKCRIDRKGDRFVSDAADLPVVMISLYGAQAYCDWLTRETDHVHRLPTEAEWEKAARGPESFVYSYGNVYKQSSANQESGKLKPVGSYQPNSFGLYDMTGNVFEWMSDKADPSVEETTLNHSLRGGSFVLDGMYLRNSFRMRQSPGVMTDDIGFRVVKEAKVKR